MYTDNMIPGKRVDPAMFKLFKADMDLFLQSATQAEIGGAMGLDKGNFSKYINGKNPITKVFLIKFYTQCGDKLKSLKKGEMPKELAPVSQETSEELTLLTVWIAVIRLEQKLDRLLKNQERTKGVVKRPVLAPDLVAMSRKKHQSIRNKRLRARIIKPTFFLPISLVKVPIACKEERLTV